MAFWSMASVLARPMRPLVTAPSILRHSSSNFTDRIKNDVKPGRSAIEDPNQPPNEMDVLIIGGGAMGSSIAYHLKKGAGVGLNVMVVERDSMYTRASTCLSMGGIRQQFSIPANVKMSMYSLQFIKAIKEHLSVDGADPPDVQFNEKGYLVLASEKGAEQMMENHKIQKECGATVELLTARQLKGRFPWMNTEGVALGSYGFENEGWFDPWSLLKAFKQKALSLGVKYINGEVTGFDINKVPSASAEPHTRSQRRVENIKIRLPNTLETVPVSCSKVVLAAGPWSGEVAELLDIGKGSEEDLLNVPLPVCPRKRYVYVLHAPDGPGLFIPKLIDYTGVHLRPEGLGGNYLSMLSPSTEEEEPSIDNLEVDYDFFEGTIWPQMAHRVPAMENIKVKSGWAGYYDYNTFDQNAIIGAHPAYSDLYLATGFSGHGIQHSAALGRAVSELILHGKFCTLDLSCFSFDRIMRNEPLLESNIF